MTPTPSRVIGSPLIIDCTNFPITPVMSILGISANKYASMFLDIYNSSGKTIKISDQQIETMFFDFSAVPDAGSLSFVFADLNNLTIGPITDFTDATVAATIQALCDTAFGDGVVVVSGDWTSGITFAFPGIDGPVTMPSLTNSLTASAVAITIESTESIKGQKKTFEYALISGVRGGVANVLGANKYLSAQTVTTDDSSTSTGFFIVNFIA